MLRLRNRINIVKHRLRHILNYLGLLVNSADVIHEGLSFFLSFIYSGAWHVGERRLFQRPPQSSDYSSQDVGKSVWRRPSALNFLWSCDFLPHSPSQTNRPMLCEFSAHRLPDGFLLRTRWLKGRDQKSNKEPDIFLQCRHHSHQTRRVTARTKTRQSLLFTASLHNHGS